MPAPPPPSKKLNSLVLPPYTAVFFALIALVILGAAFASFPPLFANLVGFFCQFAHVSVPPLRGKL